MRFLTIFQIYWLTRILITCGFFLDFVEQIIRGELFALLTSYFSSSLFHASLVWISILMLFLLCWEGSRACLFLGDLVFILQCLFFPKQMRSVIQWLAKDREIRKYIETFTLFRLAQEKALLDEDYRFSWNNRICLKSTLHKSIQYNLALEYQCKNFFLDYKYFFFWLLLETAFEMWIDREES